MSEQRATPPTRPDLMVGGDDSTEHFWWIGSAAIPSEIRRLRCPELRMAIRERAHRRADWIRAGKNPADLVIALEIDVLISDSAGAARTELLHLGKSASGETVRYVGTARGLATLILDAYVVEAADAVILRFLDSVDGESPSATLIAEQVLPLLNRRPIAA